MNKLTYKGIVKGGSIVFKEAHDLPEGAEVLVARLEVMKGSPHAVLAAMDAPPHLKPEDVDELIQQIEQGKRPVRYENPFIGKRKG